MRFGPTMQDFRFMDLLQEVRDMIYCLTLSLTADDSVLRDGLEPRHGLRYRYNQQRKLWKAIPPQGSVTDEGTYDTASEPSHLAILLQNPLNSSV